MSDAQFPPDAGDPRTEVQLSPCVGGLVRTFDADGGSRLWSVPTDEWLRSTQATGRLGRTVREGRRFRETALLSAADGTLLVRPRFPVRGENGVLTMEPQLVRLAPERRPSRSTHQDLRELLVRAVQHCAGRDEFLVVERGGWGAPADPFCLFAVLPDGDGAVSVVETAPAPTGSQVWEPYIDPANPTHTIGAPASPETIGAAPMLITEAISRWGLDPWDLGLTFGER